MKDLERTVIQQFGTVFSRPPIVLARAPGRANLIGEHTDYSGGYVMPFALDRALYAAAAPRPDGRVRVHSMDFGGETVEVLPGTADHWQVPHWARAINGAWVLLGQRGFQPGGADIVLGSDIPVGAGLSSSAASEVAAVETALGLMDRSAALTQVEKGLLAVQIEHQFLNMPSGNMDQLASAASPPQAAILLDCKTLEMTPIPLPADVRVLLLNTMVKHNLAQSEYPLRRAQVEQAAAVLGLAMLRDASLEQVEAGKEALGDLLYRRAYHVVTDNARVFAMQQAFAANDLPAAGQLLNASHASLRDNFEVSCPELELMGELARSQPGVFGARMMSGGFGGSVIALVEHSQVEHIAAQVAARYLELTQIKPETYICVPAVGASLTRI